MLNFLTGFIALLIGSLSKMSPGKLVGILALCLATWALASLFPLDMALVMAGDWAVYFEVLTAVGLISVNAHVRSSYRTLAAFVTRSIRRGDHTVRFALRFMATARSRSRQHRRKLPRSQKTLDDDPVGFAFALA